MLIPRETEAPTLLAGASTPASFFSDTAPGEQTELLEAIAQTRAILEMTADGRALRANTIFLELFGYTAEQIKHCHHHQFLTPEDAASPAFHLFWEQVLQGQVRGGEYRRVSADGRILWLQATYISIYNQAGELTKIVKIASDVTRRVERSVLEREQAHALALCVENSDCAMLVTDRAGQVLYHNEALTQLLGYRIDLVLGQPANLLDMPPLTRAFLTEFQRKLLGTEPYQTTELIYTQAQQPLWCSLTVNPVLDSQGQLLNTISVFTDITETKVNGLLQYKALEAMARDMSLLEVMQLICQEVENIAPEVVASILRVDDQGILHPLAAPSLPHAYSAALDGTAIGPVAGSCGTAAFRQEPVLARDIATDPLWAAYKHLVPAGLKACWSTPITNNDGRVVATFAFYYREVRGPNAFHQHLVALATHLCTLALEREASRDTIHQLAYYDPLTALPNRRTLLDQANQAIAQAERDETPLAVMFIDLDRFKQVNDSLGHPAGDSLLRTIAQRLRRQMRTCDIVGRLAGDEFVMVLPQCDLQGAHEILERVQHHLAMPEQHGGISVTPSASIGISLYPQDGQDMETLLHHADLAMYQAKNSGHGRFCFFTSEMNQLAQQRMSLETDLREALRTQQLQLHYQPQINLHTGLVYGVEALARWHHPRLGDISPTRFIPLAEECGLIRQLGLWVLNESCRQLSAWRRRGRRIPGMSINLSPSNFHDANLPAQIMACLTEHGLAPTDLTVEITESIMLDAHTDTLDILHRVNQLGIHLSMDDFGTGYSSLAYLRRLPIDALKLDKSFVRDLEHDPTARTLTEAVIRIGDSLNLKVIAEGVETESQRQLLVYQGYRVAQGYLFSRPLPAAALEQWLKDQEP